jgi:hypothetical protein
LVDHEPHGASVLLELLQGRQANAQNVTVKLEGGGRLGFAGACCIVCLVCCFFVSGLVWSQAGDIRELRRDNQRLNDYLAAIYAQAPSLRPKGDQEERKNSP